ncbi:MAG: aminotransferase class III-fold pyridoxal phosphate-dependent enzyme [Spirochaetes bacterium]|nr:aminotransferase class III-fold pyridoxal phosphate-dependent enzyme [Spirochaetota bacterium]
MKTQTREETVQGALKHTLFSWSKQGGLKPPVIERAEGIYLWDKDGKRYIDFSSQLINVNIGHGNKKVNEAIMAQLNKVAYVVPGMVTEARSQLGEKLAQIAPGDLNRTFFTLGGAEAIENAIKLARHYTGRHKILAAYQSFHGASYGAFTVGGDPRKLEVDKQQMPNVVHFENPYCYRCPWSQKIESCKRECVSHLERVIKFEGPDNIAAIVLEGESGSSGCIKYPPDYLQKVRALCDKYGILMIDDEVMSGFGRTGKWFGIENYGVIPDILCMAKGLTSGYLPLGGIIVSEKIAKNYDDKFMPLGLTYSAHAAACAAGVAVLEVYEEEKLIAHAAKMGDYFQKKLHAMKEKHPSIGDIRMTGLLGAIELVKNRETKEPTAPWNAKPAELEITNKISAKLSELGMYTFVRWNYIFIAPPLIITEAQADEGLAIIAEAIKIADGYCV